MFCPFTDAKELQAQLDASKGAADRASERELDECRREHAHVRMSQILCFPNYRRCSGDSSDT